MLMFIELKDSVHVIDTTWVRLDRRDGCLYFNPHDIEQMGNREFARCDVLQAFGDSTRLQNVLNEFMDGECKCHECKKGKVLTWKEYQ